jgi:alpha-glucosidase
MKRKLLSLLFLFIVLPFLALAQWRSICNVDSFERLSDGIILNVNTAKVKIYVVENDLFRIRLTQDAIFKEDHSWAIVSTPNTQQSFEVRETPEKIFLITSNATVSINKNPCRISFLDKNGIIINADEPTKGMCWSGDEVAVWKTMPADEQYFGFGEKSGSLNKKGKSFCNWNTDIPAYKADTDPLYQTIPFFYGIRNGSTYGIFFDNTFYSHFDMGKENPNQYSFGATGGELNYYFIYGPTPKIVSEKFSKLIGTTPIPPKWSIGYQQCRWSYYPESKVKEIASTFRNKNIPCDAIYLDIHYMDGYRCFTWDKQRFPDPTKMVSDLSKDGFKIVVIIDPGIKKDSTYWVFQEGINGDHFVKYPDGKYFAGTVWPGECVFPDFIDTKARDWWGSLYKGLMDNGVKGFWNDMNEPSVFNGPNKTFALDVLHNRDGSISDHRKNHNVYGMQMARGTYEGLLKLKPEERPFVLTRANYAGGQRYAAAWTGDNISSWEHLEMAVPMCLNLSISGQPFVGTDIGGFVGSPSGELYTRWLQLGVFTPLMRTHTEINSKDQEPWSYGPEYESINKKSIELRYKLLPYIYTQFYRASISGTPIMRPIFFDYPNDIETYWSEKEFLFGDAFLVAPVLGEGAKKRELRLPAGEWYDYWTDEKIVGPKYITVDASIDKIPLFVKAGSIIPTQQIVQFSDQVPIDPLTIDIYPAVQSSSILYEDDGISFNFRNGGFCLRAFELKQNKRGYNITQYQQGNYKPTSRNLVIRLHDQKEKPAKISFGKVLLTQFDWKYIKSDSILEIYLKDSFVEETLQIEY